MAQLCDPDINMIVLKGATAPEPSVRRIVEMHYQAQGWDQNRARALAEDYFNQQDTICQQSLRAK